MLWLVRRYQTSKYHLEGSLQEVNKPKSDVAQFRQNQALQEQAAYLALYGFAAGYARHDFIERRAAQGAEHILQLLQEGKQEEAFALWNNPTWGETIV